jgi:hypothetical protein
MQCRSGASIIGSNIFRWELGNFNSIGDSYFQIRKTNMGPLFYIMNLVFGIELWLIPFGIV